MSSSINIAVVAGVAAAGLALKTFFGSSPQDAKDDRASNPTPTSTGSREQLSKCPFSGLIGSASTCPGAKSEKKSSTTSTATASNINLPSDTVKTTEDLVQSFPQDFVDPAENPLPGTIPVQCPMTGKIYHIFPGSSPSSSTRKQPICPRRGDTPVHYHSYLALDQVLSAQKPKSLEVAGTLAHDEMLFIITHQTHELWFKQVLHDLESVLEIMSHSIVNERDLGKVIERLGRAVQIQRLLVNHLDILETMTPLSFLEFREFLFPASGFQSMQFRRLEVSLGLRRKNRHIYGSGDYDCALTPDQTEEIREYEKQPSLFDLIDRWLSRLPVLQYGRFDFWQEYQAAVRKMFAIDSQEIIEYCESGRFSIEIRNSRLADIKSQSKFFDSFFDENTYEEQREKGVYRLSYKACQAALMINFYQEEPLFQVPFQLLTLLMELDATLAAWRSKHAAMVHRMLGLKMGTGGSSGFAYLTETINQHKVFHELCNLASLMVPRYYLPTLPNDVSLYTSFLMRSSDVSTPPLSLRSSTESIPVEELSLIESVDIIDLDTKEDEEKLSVSI